MQIKLAEIVQIQKIEDTSTSSLIEKPRNCLQQLKVAKL